MSPQNFKYKLNQAICIYINLSNKNTSYISLDKTIIISVRGQRSIKFFNYSKIMKIVLMILFMHFKINRNSLKLKQ